MAEKYHIISPLRVTQRRNKYLDHNLTIPMLRGIPIDNPMKFALDDFNPYMHSDPTVEDTSILATQYSYKVNGTFLGRGGYVIEISREDFDKFNLDGHRHKSVKDYKADKLQFDKELILLVETQVNKFKYTFINSQTAIIIIDFVLMNYEINYIIPVNIIFRHHNSGRSSVELYINYMKRQHYSSGLDMVRLVFEVIFVISVICYIYFFIKKISKYSEKEYQKRKQILWFTIESEAKEKYKKDLEIRRKKDQEAKSKQKEKLLKIQMAKSKSLKRNFIRNGSVKVSASSSRCAILAKNQDLEKTKKIEEKIYKYVEKEIKKKMDKKFVIVLSQILFKFPSLMVSVIISLLCILFWVFFLTKSYNFWSGFPIVGKLYPDQKYESCSDSKINELYDMTYTLDTYQFIIALNYLFIFTRVFKFLSNIIKQTDIFINTFSLGWEDIQSFLILFLTICLSFVVMGFIYFRNVSTFQNFSSCLQQVFSFSLGIIEDKTYIQMYKQNMPITIIYLLLVIILVKFIILKIILAILLYYFNYSANLFEAQNVEISLEGKQLEELKDLIPNRPYYRMIMFYKKNKYKNN